MTEPEIVVVGAGAAGLWAAERAARTGKRVLLLEKTPRAGTKVLASGGTRCNLTTTLDAKGAARLFGAAELFLLPCLKGMSPQRVRRRFHELGVPTVEEPALEKVFPESQQALDVRNALLAAALLAGVVIRYNTPVLGISPGDSWTLDTPAGLVRAPKLLLCTGGQSYPKTGTTGDAYGWLRKRNTEISLNTCFCIVISFDNAIFNRCLYGESVVVLSASGKNLQRYWYN